MSMKILDFWKKPINVTGDGARLAAVHSYNEWEKSEAERLEAKSREDLKAKWKKEKEENEAEKSDKEAAVN
jgi:hypothetical protein